MGLWKNVTLLGYNTAVLKSATAETAELDLVVGNWSFTTNITFNAATRHSGSLTITIDGYNETFTFPVSLVQGENVQSFTLNLTGIQLWWPNGYGEPVLYAFTYQYEGPGGESSTFTQKVGFRTVQLNQVCEPTSRHNYSESLCTHARTHTPAIFHSRN